MSTPTINMSMPLGSDAHFFEESIHPSTIRSSLSSVDPSSPTSTPVLIKGMKWLLAMMSKGRDLSDFFPAVVKLVGAPSLEARKMVYMYLVHYADHDDTCRELALLSINSFQRGLADTEQLIRALALRVMSSIRVTDILQIQILAVQKCSKDPSPYVRKCAANALTKLHSQCSITERNMLKELLKNMLNEDNSTMVLTSVIIAFWELYPEEYQMLHGSFRKLCHLLTDMDEWGQVIAMECLAAYCRRAFRKPKGGSGELVDKERRLRRMKKHKKNIGTDIASETVSSTLISTSNMPSSKDNHSNSFSHNGVPKKIKRRVVRKAFYSDEEDESSEEEVYTSTIDGKPLTLAAALRDQQVTNPTNMMQSNNPTNALDDNEDEDLDPDHRLLLRSSLPLLKSRNSAVVLAVCSLHYYCGVSSIKIRTALGKALVRIHRDRREIQYVVLTSIRELVGECPSAFTPFLADFFVKAMDPSFTRMIKLDILTNLALEPQSITDILHEIRSYVRHDDKHFVCASIQAIGRITEISQIVYARIVPDPDEARAQSNTIALNCLHGLVALIRCSRNKQVIGQCVLVMTNIAGLVMDTDTKDPNDVRGDVVRRLMFLLTRSLVYVNKEDNDEEEDAKDEEGNNEWNELMDKETLCLPTDAMASALWLVGEWFCSSQQTNILKMDKKSKNQMNHEILRLLTRSFPEFESMVKLQAIHYASKMLLMEDSLLSPVCSHILAQGRLDINPDVRDRARFESSLLSLVAPTFLNDFDNTVAKPINSALTPGQAKTLLLSPKPPSSTLPLDGGEKVDQEEVFRFGTLSSLLHHRAGKAYLPLPPWAEVDSDKSLRDPPVPAMTGQEKKKDDSVHGFYDDEFSSDAETSSSERSSDESSDEDDSSEDESDNEATSSSEEESSSEETSEDESSEDESSEEEEEIKLTSRSNGNTNKIHLPPSITKSMVDDYSEEESSSSDDDSEQTSEDDDSYTEPIPTSNVSDSLIPMSSNTISKGIMTIPSPEISSKKPSVEDLSNDLSGLVMAPLVVDAADDNSPSDIDSDSGQWYRLIRPEIAGGLSLEARYIRGETRKRELYVAKQNIGDSTVLLQLKFENKRTDMMALRRIRILQRTSPTLRQAILPLEISALKKKQSSSTFLILSFLDSNNVSSLSARFEVKSDKGTTAIDIRPPLVEMLRKVRLNESEFENVINKLSGPHQKTASTFEWHETSDLFERIETNCNLTPILKNGKGKNVWKFVASQPHTKDIVCVIIEKAEFASIMIYCDNTIAANAIMESVKSEIAK